MAHRERGYLDSRLGARTWLSLFLLGAATLAFEINLTRLFSVSQFYHLAFMIVSIALLGYGASGTALSVWPTLQRGSPHDQLARWALGAAVGMPGSYLLFNWLPFDSFSIAWDGRQAGILALHYAALAAPFFFGGLAVGSLLGRFSPQANAVYAANLFGSAAGCILALAMPSLVGGEGAVSVCAGLAAIAALMNAATLQKRRTVLTLITVGVLAWSGRDAAARAMGGSMPGAIALKLSPYKGLSHALQSPTARVVRSEWNAFSRIDVVTGTSLHAVPGLSYRYLEPLPQMDGLFVDGDDLSPIVDAGGDAGFAPFLPSALAFQLRPRGSVLVLGPRGGLDALVALEMNTGPKTVVEVNPLITELAPIYSDARLDVQVESERSFLRRVENAYDVIVVSLPYAYHPVRSGAYALGEDYRYTVEAFEQALKRLEADGVLIAMRWLQEPPSEDLRLFALAAAAVERTGGDPAAQVIAFRGFNVGTVMIKNAAYSGKELAEVRDFLEARAFDLSYAPDVREDETNRFNVLRASGYYATYAALMDSREAGTFFPEYPYDVRPPTDDHPFFGHYFKWAQARQLAAELGKAWQPFGGAGYFVVIALLLIASLLAALLIVLPVVVRGAAAGEPITFKATDLLYFAFLGFGFLLVEIPLLQMFILYLEQPAYATGLVLFFLLLFAGIGSRLSGVVGLRPGLAILAPLVLAGPHVMRLIIDRTLGEPLPLRVAITGLMLLPMGVLMGIPFPAGIRRMSAGLASLGAGGAEGAIAWVWAVNGAASVVASILAALLALTFGFSSVLLIGALSYGGALVTEVWRPARPRCPGL